jgi:hexosaminidase
MKTRLLLLILLCLFLKGSFAQDITPKDDFKIRGFHLDLRIQVMKMPALKKFAKNLSKQGINTLVMEWEATYPFLKDPLISNRYAYTRAEIKDFISYCQTLHIDVIPLQQSFGHVDYILRNSKYAALREDSKDLSQVCPSETALNKELFTRLFTDMAAMHPSPYFHIGGDETRLLGHCEKCKKRAAEVGISRLYFDHIKMLCDIVVGLGKRPVIWADIALKYPQYIHLLPKQTVFVDWNYGWEMNHFGAHEELAKSGYEIWGAPSIRSSPDNYSLTKWQYHFNNIRDFIPTCKKLGYNGIVMTSWSTSGVYAGSYESEDDLVDFAALRHVYPITGFGILISAYTKAIGLNHRLDVGQFITEYCNTRFGFNNDESQQFRKALFTAPYTVAEGKVEAHGNMTIETLLDSARFAAKTFHSLHPKSNGEIFRHFELMADIRVHYLSYHKIEKEVNEETITTTNIKNYLARLKLLMSEEPDLNKRFIALNREVLNPAAMDEENQLRNQKIHLLYDRLARVK